MAGPANCWRVVESGIQVRAEDIHQQVVQREYHLYNRADKGWVTGSVQQMVLLAESAKFVAGMVSQRLPTR